MPPAPLDERPTRPLTDRKEDSDSDDDYGPSMPPADASKNAGSPKTAISPEAPTPAPSVTMKRDEWMTVAPTTGDWSSRVDPTKLKNRKFNTGRGSKGAPQSSSGGDSSWYETPEQKQARLKKEMMGIKDSTSSMPASTSKAGGNAVDDAKAKRLKDYNVRFSPAQHMGLPLALSVPVLVLILHARTINVDRHYTPATRPRRTSPWTMTPALGPSIGTKTLVRDRASPPLSAATWYGRPLTSHRGSKKQSICEAEFSGTSTATT
jgi:hypothetical protein